MTVFEVSDPEAPTTDGWCEYLHSYLKSLSELLFLLDLLNVLFTLPTKHITPYVICDMILAAVELVNIYAEDGVEVKVNAVRAHIF
jgi:hypothetical protein